MGVTRDDAPLTGREVQIAAALKALGARGGAIIVGSRGAGRSRVLQEVVARDPHIVAVDDVHLLDEAEARAIGHAVERGRSRLAVTAPTGAVLPSAIERLVKDRRLERIDLPDLLPAQVTAIAARFVDPALSADDVHRTLLTSSTDLVLVREVIHDSVRQPRGGNAADPLHSFALARGVGNSMASEPGPRAVLEILAFANELPIDAVVDTLRRLEPAVATSADAILDSLEEIGTVSALPEPYGSPELVIRLTDRLLGRVIARTTRPMRRRAVAAALSDALGSRPGGADDAELLALTLARLETGAAVEPDDALRAARRSLRGDDIPATLRVAMAAATSGGFDAELVLAVAESQAGLVSQAAERLGRLVDRAGTDLERATAVATLTSLTAVHDNDPRAVLDVGDRAFAGMSDAAARAEAVAGRGLILHAIGDSTGATALLEPVLNELHGESLQLACFAVSNGAILQGRLRDARRALSRAEGATHAPSPGATRVLLARALVLGYEARFTEALAIVAREREAAVAAGDIAAVSLIAWAEGGLLLTMGRVVEAEHALRSAASTLEALAQVRVVRLVRTDLARAVALAGRPEEATALIADLLGDEHARRGLFDLEGKTLQALGCIRSAEGRLLDARRAFEASAAAYAANEHDLAALFSLTDAARHGAAVDLMPSIHRVAARVEGRFAQLAVRLAEAIAQSERGEGDAVALEALGVEAAEASLHLLAAEAFARAANLHAAAGLARPAAAARRRGADQREIGGVAVGAPHLDIRRIELSARESEVARLAADGLGNRQIAARLVLSVRTVETHLQRAYVKLGVTTRNDLTAALR